MDEARGRKGSRWVFRLVGIGVLALILVLAARTSPGGSTKAVSVVGPSGPRAASTTCAAEDAQEQAAQTAAYVAAHNEDVQEDRNPPANARAEDLAEHNAYVQAHLADTAEDEAEGTGYGACTDSARDIALPAG